MWLLFREQNLESPNTAKHGMSRQGTCSAARFLNSQAVKLRIYVARTGKNPQNVAPIKGTQNSIYHLCEIHQHICAWAWWMPPPPRECLTSPFLNDVRLFISQTLALPFTDTENADFCKRSVQAKLIFACVDEFCNFGKDLFCVDCNDRSQCQLKKAKIRMIVLKVRCDDIYIFIFVLCFWSSNVKHEIHSTSSSLSKTYCTSATS
jgi:hypothetical protein